MTRTNPNISVYKRKIIKTTAPILPKIPNPDNFLYAFVFFKSLINPILPNIPEATQTALKVLVC